MSFIRWSVIAGFIIGILAGAAGLNMVTGTHMDRAELEIERLNAELAESYEQISALEKTLAQHKKAAVTEIEVHVAFKDGNQRDELTTLGITKTVRELLTNIRGREVSTLDPQLIVNIVDGREIEISNREFVLTVRSLLVSEKLIMDVEAKEKISPANKAARETA